MSQRNEHNQFIPSIFGVHFFGTSR